ncbi:LLM class flavin-dependent oxidoreductase [Actinomadura sp. 3N407]|uniref:LLM class flavin-dependent oxidoreductase n=1 Tax=Actinomadura sp. 3N407 TaxID=3457423 RepID=UPI003FCD40AB
MKIGMISESQVNKGMSFGVRLREVLKELTFAEEMGFDFAGTSEQHFMDGQWAVSAPEIVLTALAERTSSIKLRYMACVALGFNHPVRAAERFATQDILAPGRLEVATARSNNAVYQRGFGVNPATTSEEQQEWLEVVIRSLLEPEVEVHGKFFDVGPVTVTPPLERKTPLPFYMTTTSPASHTVAGKLGLGCMTADTFMGWEFQQQLVDAYKNGFAQAKPIGGLYEPTYALCGFTFPAYCAATRQEAFDHARVNSLGLINHVIELAEGLSGTGAPGYQYWGELAENLHKHGHDLDYVEKSTPMLMLGTPDDFIEKIKRLEEMGMTEVVLKLDGFGHARTMRAIEMVGKYVIPEFKARQGSIPPSALERVGIEGVETFQL